MKKRKNNNYDIKNENLRRDFLRKMVLGTGGLMYLNPAKIFIAGLFDEMFRRNSAHAAGITADFKFVNFLMLGGAPRWCMDLPLKPLSTSPFTQNATAGTRFDANLNLVYDTYSNSNFNGILMPSTWASNIPTSSGGSVAMSTLAPNMLIAMGIDQKIDSHTIGPQMQVLPVSGKPSLTGLVADAALTPIPSVSYSGNFGTGPVPFVSAKGLTNMHLGRDNPLTDALNPFNNASGLKEISNASVRTAINNVMSAMQTNAAAKHEYLPNSYTQRQNAQSLMMTAFGNLQTAFTTLKAKYQTLIFRSFTESAFFLPNVETVTLPGINNNLKSGVGDSQYYTGSNFNAIFTSSYIPNVTISNLAGGMAVAEFMLTSGYSSTLNIAIGGVENVKLQSYTDSSGTTADKSWGFGLDMHSTGSDLQLVVMAKYTRAYMACMNELITRLKATAVPGGGNLFDKTMIQTSGDFNRTARADRKGSDHGYESSVVSWFSGMVQNLTLAGNIKSETNSGYLGCFGKGASIVENSNQELRIGNVASTVSTALGIPSPTPNDISVVSKNSAGKLVATLPMGKSV